VTRTAPTTGIEQIQALNDALQRGDREGFRELIEGVIHPDCEWQPLITGVEGADHYRGREGMAEFFDDFIGSFEVRYVEQEFRPVGDRGVLMLTVMRVRGRESGVEVSREVGCIFEFEDGLVRRARAYESHAEAAAAAEALHA
jgi:ketosteroid isomerase-like protein